MQGMWTKADDGTLTCSEHETVFSSGRVCPSCPVIALTPTITELGDFEILEKEAARRGLPSRLDAEAMLLRSVGQAARLRKLCVKRSLCLLSGGATTPLQPSENGRDPADEASSRWMTLAAKWADIEGKMARAVGAVVHSREERAMVERDDRKLRPLMDRRAGRRSAGS